MVLNTGFNAALQALEAVEADGDGSASEDPDEEGAEPHTAGVPAYPALQARRDAVRGWLCVLYAFAAPNRHVELAQPC